mmetsp:Transcript_23914/g.60162  ORF Transcript_23914/g.60162 Transcript_23914/m.60162 type:complete len:542 (-) Transcript_23914:23-1648(-)
MPATSTRPATAPAAGRQGPRLAGEGAAGGGVRVPLPPTLRWVLLLGVGLLRVADLAKHPGGLGLLADLLHPLRDLLHRLGEGGRAHARHVHVAALPHAQVRGGELRGDHLDALLHGEVADVVRAPVRADALLQADPGGPGDVAGGVRLDGALEQVARERDVAVLLLQAAPGLEHLAHVARVGLGPDALLEQPARLLKVAQPPLHHAVRLPQVDVLVVHLQAILEVLPRVGVLPRLRLQHTQRLVDGAVHGVLLQPLGQDAAGLVQVAQLLLHGAPGEVDEAAARVGLQAAPEQRARLPREALLLLHQRPRLPDGVRADALELLGAAAEPVARLLHQPRALAQQPERLVQVGARLGRLAQALHPQLARADQVALLLLQQPPAVPGRHMRLARDRRGVVVLAGLVDVAALGLERGPRLPDVRVLALRGGAALLVHGGRLVVAARQEVVAAQRHVRAPVRGVHLDRAQEARLHLLEHLGAGLLVAHVEGAVPQRAGAVQLQVLVDLQWHGDGRGSGAGVRAGGGAALHVGADHPDAAGADAGRS